MRDRVPPWLVAAGEDAIGTPDSALVAAATAAGAGLVVVGDDGSVSWTDEAYRVHGRPRWRRVRAIEDAIRGLSTAEAGRVTAAYLELVGGRDIEVLYTVTAENGEPLDVLLYSAWPGVAVVERASYVAVPVVPIVREPRDLVPATPPAPVEAVERTEPAGVVEDDVEPTPEAVATAQDRAARDLAAAAFRAAPDVAIVMNLRAPSIEVLGGANDVERAIAERFASGAAAAEMVHPDDVATGLDWRASLAELADGDVQSVDLRMARPSGGWAWRELRATPLEREPDGSLRTVLVISRDIDERTIAHQRREASERAFREVFDASPSGLVVLDDDGRFLEANEAFCRLVGRTPEDLLATVYEALTHHEDRASAVVARTRRTPEAAAANEHRLLRSDGSIVWVRTRTSSVELESGTHLLVSVENVTADREREDQLRHDALHDALTGMPNRRLLEDRLDRALSRSRRTGSRLAVFFVDLDDLKHVNDTHPWKHRAGDVLLTSVAAALRETMRETDTLGRLGGDEFLAICEDAGDDAAVTELGERLLDAVRQPVALGPVTHVPSASVGVAVTDTGDEDRDALLQRADQAMYVAKSRGGSRLVRADDVVPETPTADLLGALARHELRLQYQPVVSLASGAMLGVNAVLRWQHPTLGLLPAHEVRDALEAAATLPVVDWCIERVMADVRTVAPDRVEHLSVWLSVPGRALHVASTVEAIRAATAGPGGDQTPDSAPNLVLDVHESDLAALVRRPMMLRHLDELATVGHVALGVEHLSADTVPIGSLQLVGAATASIDPELVAESADNQSVENLVRSLVTAATALGVVTIATGIGTPELLQQARRLGVHAVQGDLIGPAASLGVYSDLMHGERAALPRPEGRVDVADAEPHIHEAARPVLAAIEALELQKRAQDADAGGTDAESPAEVPAAVDDEPEPATEPAQAESPGVPPAVSASAPETAEAAETVEAAEPGRLLLDDVVDLAEQVARELGIALPSDDELRASRAPMTSAAAQVRAPRVVPSAAPATTTPAPAPRRLPGMADLDAALASPEVRRAIPDARMPAVAPEPVDPAVLRERLRAFGDGPRIILRGPAAPSDDAGPPPDVDHP